MFFAKTSKSRLWHVNELTLTMRKSSTNVFFRSRWCIWGSDWFPCGSEIDTIDLITCKFQDSFEPNLKFLLYKFAMSVYTLTTFVYLCIYTVNKGHSYFSYECPQESFVGYLITAGYFCYTFQFIWVTLVLFLFYLSDRKLKKKDYPTIADLPNISQSYGFFLFAQQIGQNMAFPVFFGYWIWDPKFDTPGLVFGLFYFLVVIGDEIFNLHRAPRKWFYVPILPYIVLLIVDIIDFRVLRKQQFEICEQDGKLDTRFLGEKMEGRTGLIIFYFLKLFEIIISYFCMVYLAAVVKNCIRPSDDDEEDED